MGSSSSTEDQPQATQDQTIIPVAPLASKHSGSDLSFPSAPLSNALPFTPDLWTFFFQVYLPPRTLKVLSSVSRSVWNQVWQNLKAIRFSTHTEAQDLGKFLLRAPGVELIDLAWAGQENPIRCADFAIAALSRASITPTHLNLSRNSLEKTSLAVLATLPLVHLDLGGCELDDDVVDALAPFKALTSLKTLNLRGLPVSQSLVHVGSLTNLTCLNIGELQMYEKHLFYLQGLLNLQVLDLSNNQNLQRLGYLQALPKLEEVRMKGCPCLNADRLSHWGHLLTQLKTLDASSSKIDFKGAVALPHMISLTKIDLSGFEPQSDKAWVHIGHMTNLKTLKLTNSKLNDYKVEKIGKLTNLEDLFIGDAPPAPLEGPIFENLTQLKSLHFQNVGPTFIHLNVLSNFTKLETLIFDNCSIRTRIKLIPSLTCFTITHRCPMYTNQDFMAFTNLTELNLGVNVGQPRSEATVEAILTNTNLKSLLIGGATIETPNPFLSLRNHWQLKHLHFQNVRVHPRVWSELRGCPVLETLIIDTCPTIYNDSLANFQDHPHLHTLQIINCTRITSDCLTVFEKFVYLSKLSFVNCRAVGNEAIQEMKNRIDHQLEVSSTLSFKMMTLQ